MSARRPQLRVCSRCGKPGHNKSTCPILSTPPKKTGEVKFFIYGQPPAGTRSAHLVNLKQPGDFWQKIEASAPEKNQTNFQRYHQMAARKEFEMDSLRQLADRGDDNQKETKKIEAKKMTAATDAVVIPTEAPTSATPPTRFARSGSARNDKITNQPTKQFPRQRKEFFGPRQPWKFSWKRAALAAAFSILVTILPQRAAVYYQSIKQTTAAVAAEGIKGFMALQDSASAAMQADINGAAISTDSALASFNSAVEEMNSRHTILQKIAGAIPLVGGEVQGRQKILTAGQKIAAGNSFLIKGLAASQKNPQAVLTERIAIIADALNAARPNYEAALTDLSGVNAEILPTQYQAAFKDFRLLFAALTNDLRQLSDLSGAVREIFGGQGLRRYLFVFQNPHELRPTGGFLGSFAVIDFKDGKIVGWEIPAGGSYDLQGQLDQLVEPPTPLLLSNKRWEFQDANWFPDFPSSAEKMLWFLRHSRQITADGVIAVNATVLERMLAVVGPMEDEKRGLTLTSDNAIKTIQQVVEEGPEKKDNKPKQIIADLAPKFLEAAGRLKPEQILPLLNQLTDALAKKEIQTYFTDPSARKVAADFGWDGRILSTKNNQDYLMVVNANIQGQKTDAQIRQTISHQSVVDADGSIIDTVTIKREHLGLAGEKLYGQTNVDFLRLYAPLGSQLISAAGFSWPDERKFRAPEKTAKKDETLLKIEKETGVDPESGTRVTEEFGKTAFGNWVITEPGQTSEVRFIYRLPFTIPLPETKIAGWSRAIGAEKLFSQAASSQYQLLVQRQSGANSAFESQVIYPAGWHPAWNDGDGVSLAQNGLSVSLPSLEKDAVWSLLMKRD